MAATKTFESPLVSHARMRSMYRALVEMTALGQRKGARVRSSSPPRKQLSEPLRHKAKADSQLNLPHGLEACWVGTAIGLEAGDLTSDARSSALIAHIRAAGMRVVDRGPHASELSKIVAPIADVFAGSAADRMLCAIGGAMALKRSGTKNVMTAYIRQMDLPLAEWRRILPFVAAEPLPLVIVVLPTLTGRSPDLPALVRRIVGAAIPVIPVDAADVLALYRVTQEALVRARTGGGSVVIEAVASGLDPAKLFAGQLRAKKICTARWFIKVEASAQRMLTQLRH